MVEIMKEYFKKTEIMIEKCKEEFVKQLCSTLNLIKVTAPIFVESDTGLNDDLNGTERMVSFDLKCKKLVSVVHSLAKWKRYACGKYGFDHDTGLVTDMKAIRRDEDITRIHSYFVDQWDWELVIKKEERKYEKLVEVVEKIFAVLKKTEEYVNKISKMSHNKLPEKITFVSTQEIEDEYPDLTPRERENAIAKKYGAVFLTQIGKKLKSGKVHDGRAPDYDDWEINGDIIVYNDVLDDSFEISSMGIRVDEKSLIKQLEISGKQERMNFLYHRQILNKELPYTVGGGIGQSRVLMFFLEKQHIGEVQVSVWPEEVEEDCLKKGIFLL